MSVFRPRLTSNGLGLKRTTTVDELTTDFFELTWPLWRERLRECGVVDAHDIALLDELSHEEDDESRKQSTLHTVFLAGRGVMETLARIGRRDSPKLAPTAVGESQEC